jgi:hypothetical protein
MRRCEEMIKAYDASSPLPQPVPPAAARNRRRATQAPAAAPIPVTAPPVPAAHDYVGEALPHAARLQKGKWSYARRDATLRGLKVKWIESGAFSREVLATPHFIQLRRNAVDTAPSHVAAVMRSIAEQIASDIDPGVDEGPVAARYAGQEEHARETEERPQPVALTAAVSTRDGRLPALVAATRGRVELPRLVPPYAPTDRRFSSPPYGVRPSGAAKVATPRASSPGAIRPTQLGKPLTGRPGTVRPPHDVSPPDMPRTETRLAGVTSSVELPQPIALATRTSAERTPPQTTRPLELPQPAARGTRPSTRYRPLEPARLRRGPGKEQC